MRAGFGWRIFHSPNTFAIHFLPIIMIVSSFLLQKMTPMPRRRSEPAENDAVHAAHVGLLLLVGIERLVLYWLTGNFGRLAQQWFFNKTARPLRSQLPVRKTIHKGRQEEDLNPKYSIEETGPGSSSFSAGLSKTADSI